jgi:hypothetical protein
MHEAPIPNCMYCSMYAEAKTSEFSEMQQNKIYLQLNISIKLTEPYFFSDLFRKNKLRATGCITEYLQVFATVQVNLLDVQ